jgi:hypothetical protein
MGMTEANRSKNTKTELQLLERNLLTDAKLLLEEACKK